MARHARLPDHIRPGLRVLFVGINPGRRSAAVGHHFAGYSNRFWKLVYASKLVPIPLTYEDDARLPEWGFGITNLIARSSRGVEALRASEYAAGRKELLAKVRRYRPQVVALLGVTLYPVLVPNTKRAPAGMKAKAQRPRLGVQPHNLADSTIFLLPNPSGRNAHYSYQEMLKVFRKLKNAIVALE